MELEPSAETPDSAEPSAVPAFGTVLCAVDGLPSAAGVLYAAAGFAAHPRSNLVVLRVDSRANASPEKQLSAQVELQDLARHAIPGWAAYRDATEFILRSGDPARTILAVAAECDAQLIVIGTHAEGFIRRTLFGSVVERVLLGTTVPVAVVPPSQLEVISLTANGASPHLGSVLVPVSLDEGSGRQLAFASTLSLASTREAVLLHVVPHGADSHAPLKRLQEMTATVGAHAGVRTIVTHGSVVGAILDRQLQVNAGVIVMGRDPRSPGQVARNLLGRTSSVVVFVP